MRHVRQLTTLMISTLLLCAQVAATEEVVGTAPESVGQAGTQATSVPVEQAALETVRVQKYAVAADGHEVSTSISHEVGRAPYFLILNERGDLIEVIQNPYLELKFGLGPIVADMLAEKEVTMLIGGFAGPNMHHKLKAQGIQFTHGKGGVKRVMSSLRGDVHADH